MNWEVASTVRIGGRTEQQDSVGWFAAPDGESFLLVVADGMGGHRGGSLASQALLEIAARNWTACAGMPVDPKQFLEDLCQQAHREINQRGQELDLEPHTTVAAVIVRGDRAFWVHVGDSRLYHFRGSELLGRTKDHSVLQILVESGEVAEEDMATHPDQNKLLRSIGGEDPPRVTHGDGALQPQDRFLLCTDGFWERITPDEMASALAEDDLQAALNRAADWAAERNGPKGDNIAVVALRAAPAAKRRRRSSRTGRILMLLVLLAVVAAVAFLLVDRLTGEIPAVEATDTEPDAELARDIQAPNGLNGASADVATDAVNPAEILEPSPDGVYPDIGVYQDIHRQSLP